MQFVSRSSGRAAAFLAVWALMFLPATLPAQGLGLGEGAGKGVLPQVPEVKIGDISDRVKEAAGKGQAKVEEAKQKAEDAVKEAAEKGKGSAGAAEKAKGPSEAAEKGQAKKEAATEKAKGGAAQAEKGAGQAKKEVKAKAGKPDARVTKQLNQESKKHLKRLAQFNRLQAVAEKKKDDKLLEKIAMLREKEMKRHGRVLARLNAGGGES